MAPMTGLLSRHSGRRWLCPAVARFCRWAGALMSRQAPRVPDAWRLPMLAMGLCERGPV